MRLHWSNNLAVFSIAFLFLIPVWIYLIAPQVLRLSSNFNLELAVISTDNFYDEEQSAYLGAQYSQTEFSFKTVSSTYDTSLIENQFNVQTLEGEPIVNISRQYGVNRFSRKHVASLGDKPRSGYLFAPKNLKENQTFVYWHINYDAPATMVYQSEEQLHGMRVFKYKADYSNQNIDQTNDLTNIPEVGKTRGVKLEPELTIWVEPRTGNLIKYSDNTTAYYYDLDTGETIAPWNKFTNIVSDASVRNNIEHTQFQKDTYNFVEIYVPIFFLMIASILFFQTKRLKKFLQRRVNQQFWIAFVGTFIIVISTVILLGWQLKYDDFIRLGISDGATLNPLTAVFYIILGFIIAFKPIAQKRYIYVLSSILIILAIVRFAGIYELIDLQLDQVLYKDYVVETRSRMSVFTTLSFFLLGFSVLISQLRFFESLFIVVINATTTLLLAVLVLLGYLVTIFGLISLPFFQYTSLNTVILMIISSIMVMVLFRSKDEVKLSTFNKLMLFATLLGCIIVTIYSASAVEQNLYDDAQEIFTEKTVQSTEDVKDRVHIYINLLQGSKGLLAASEYVSREEWKIYVDSLYIEENFFGLQGIGYSILIEPDNLKQHVEDIREEGYPDYSVYPEGDRSLYTSIIYLEPFNTRNQEALGFDMFQDPVRRSAMSQARDTGEPRLTGKVTLVQEIDDDVQPGFLIYLPFYKDGSSPETVEERREKIVGYVYSPFRTRNFIEGILVDSDLEDISLSLYDGVDVSSENILFSDTDEKFSEGLTNAKFEKTQILYIAGRPWTFHYESSEFFAETKQSRIVPLVILGLGIFVSVLITLITYVILSSRDKAVAYADKITKDLKTDKAKDEAMLSSIGDGLVATDEKGLIMLVNKAFTDILQWTEQEAMGKDFADLVPMHDKEGNLVPRKDRLVDMVLENNPDSETSTDWFYSRKDGSKFPVAVNTTPINVENRFIGRIKVFRDVTLEKEIDKAKTEFVSLASHQLRTPLTAINWNVELLQDPKVSLNLTEDQLTFLSEIVTSSKRMTNLISSLLNVSRIELGTFSVNPEKSNLYDLLREVYNEFQHIIKKKSLTINISKVPIPKIYVDTKLMQMIYQNLISNAIKYTPKGGTITIKHKQELSNILITVEDNGLGIPKRQQKDVFKKLFRADNVVTSDTEGTGLGLYIVKSVLDQTGGKIWFDSTEGSGTIFYVEIPLTGMEKRTGSKFLEQTS